MEGTFMKCREDAASPKYQLGKKEPEAPWFDECRTAGVIKSWQTLSEAIIGGKCPD
jgi:hypothetical protein